MSSDLLILTFLPPILRPIFLVIYLQLHFTSAKQIKMMFSKILVLALPALVSAVVPSGAPTTGFDDFFGECYGEPVALACDTDPTSIVPSKSTLILEDYHITVTASIACEGNAAAGAVCIGPEEDGGVGVIVSGDRDDGPMCYTIFYFEEGVKKYKALCRGKDFRIKQELHITKTKDTEDEPEPTRRLGQANE